MINIMIFGVKLTNRAGTISVGDQEKIDPKKIVSIRPINF